MKKDAVLAQFRTEGVLGLVEALPAAALIDCARALAAAGLHALEIAMTTPAVLSALRAASDALPEFLFGLGTVLDVETARDALGAGARFIVTPAPRPDVITYCRRFNVPVVSGAFNAQDVLNAHHFGAVAAKIFPGEVFGPEHVRAIRAAAPDVPLLPIGGVTPETIAEFLRAGADAAYAGRSLVDTDIVQAKAWGEVTARGRRFRAAVDGFCVAAKA